MTILLVMPDSLGIGFGKCRKDLIFFNGEQITLRLNNSSGKFLSQDTGHSNVVWKVATPQL